VDPLRNMSPSSLVGDLGAALDAEKYPKGRRELAATAGLFPSVSKRCRTANHFLPEGRRPPRPVRPPPTHIGRAGPASNESVAGCSRLLKDTNAPVRKAAAFALVW